MFNAQDIILARQFKPDLSISKLDTESLILLQIMNHARGGGVVPVYDADITNGIASFDGVTRSKPLVSLKLNIPVTQTGSGTPSPTNIRDFVGVSGVNVTRTGKNIWGGLYLAESFDGKSYYYSLDTVNKYFVFDRRASSYTNSLYTNFKPNTQYTLILTCSLESAGTNNCLRIRYTDNTVNAIKIANDTKETIIFTTNVAKSVRDIIITYNDNSRCRVYYEESGLFEGVLTADEYEAYNGNTYQISFGQTVYSANLDVLTGKLYLTHELKTIDENSDIQRAENGIIFLNNFFEIDEDTESINCNVYQRGENRGTVAQVSANNPDLSFCCKLGTNTNRIMIKDTRFTSIENYKTWLSTNPVKIAVKLAEPIEIQLTPTQITTLIGENVIFADVGDITECKFTRK